MERAEELLKLEHVKKAYDGQEVLKDFSLTVHRGEVIVIVGASGCGKSTLLRCINGLEPIQGGRISLQGQVIDGRAKNIADIRQKIGMVFQSYDLFPIKRLCRIRLWRRSRCRRGSAPTPRKRRKSCCGGSVYWIKRTIIPDSYRAARSRGRPLYGH